MKRLFPKTLFSCLATAALLSLASCSSEPVPAPQTGTIHYDVWVPLSKATGQQDESYVVHRAETLTEGALKMEGTGADITGQLTPETILRGQYYYQVNEYNRFVKAEITPTGIRILKQIPSAYFKKGKYAHAWLDDRTLVLAGADGEGKKVLWVKYDVEAMKEIASGTLELPAPPEGMTFTSSGLLGYRAEDGKLLYSFHYKKKGMTASPLKKFEMAFVDAKTMKVEKLVSEDRAEMMAGTVFGELRQNKTFFDEKGNYYIACNSVLPGEKTASGRGTTTAQHGALLRINAGETDFDKSYNGYTKNSRGEVRGKIVTVDYLGDNKALLYMQDPKFARPDEEPVWDTKSDKKWVFYWIVLDLTTGEQKWLDKIPFSNGNFSQLALVKGSEVYIANNSQNENSCVYIYNWKTGDLKKGLTFADKGATMDRITMVLN